MATTRAAQEAWRAGLNTEADAKDLDGEELRAALNVFITPRGDLKLRTGQHNLIPTQAALTRGFTRYQNASIARLVRAQGTGIIARDESAATETFLTSSAFSGTRVEFAKLYDYVFWVDGSSALKFWRGVGGAAITAGILPPGVSTGNVTTVIDRNATDSNLRFGPTAMEWYVAFADANGILSSPAKFATLYPESSTDTFKVSFSSVPTSAEARVTARWIYRGGGNLAVPVRVGIIADNTTLTFTDNVSDLNAGTINLPNYDILPPLGAKLILASRNRLLLADDKTLYVSTKGSPEYFPIIPVDKILDGQRFDIDADLTNPIVALGGTGSLVLIARAKSIHSFDGDDVYSFAVRKVADVGCIARRSLVMCKSVAVWLGPDANVYALASDGTPRLMSQPIQDKLHGLSVSVLSLACAAYHRGRYILSIPQPSGSTSTPVVLAMDFNHPVTDEDGRTRYAWTDLSGRNMAAAQLYADTGFGDLDELLFATDSSYLQPDTTAYTGIQSSLARTDTTTDLPIDIRSGDLEYGKPDWVKRITSVRINGTITPKAATTPTLKLYADDVLQETFSLLSVNGTLLIERVNAAMQGQRLAWRIEGTVRAASINTVELGIAMIRQVQTR